MTLRGLLFCLTLACTAAVDPALLQVKTIYLMPMSAGLDQYLANRLTKAGQYRIVTDPSGADAIFTDKIGPAFETAFEELYPSPKPVAPPSPAANAVKDEKQPAARELSAAEAMADYQEPTNRINAFSRSRGNVFLIDRRTKQVIWSEYRRPKSFRADDIDKVADRISDRLHADIRPKK